MRRLRAAVWRLVGSFTRARRERDLAAELESHLQLHIDDNLRAGMTPADARRRALVALGGVEQTKERVRDARGTLVDSIRQDVVFALRLMRRSPAVTLVAVASLALGIGATTALFSVYDSLILRDLPVREPHRLVLLADSQDRSFWSNTMWEEIRRQPDLFDGAFAFDQLAAVFHVTQGERTDVVDGLWASGRFFDVLGVPAMLGRTFRETDDRRGGGPDGPVAVISHAFWQRRFGGAADVIGQRLVIERVPFTIVGVTPPEFFGLQVGRAFDVAVPIGTEPLVLGRASMLDERDYTWLRIVGRLAPGATRDAAQSALARLEPSIRDATRPAVDPNRPARPTGTFVLRDMATGTSRARASYQKPLVLIMGIAGFVLLIACANIANLLLARAAARGHEIGVRRALGASSLRLVRLCLVESLLLAGSGAVLGLAVARGGSRLLVAQLSSVVSTFYLQFPLDWRVLAFTAAVAATTAVLFGTAPAWQAARVRPATVLGASARTLAGAGRQRLGQALVAAQVALSLVLLVGAVLFVRTFAALTSRDVGFDPDRILVATADAQRSGATRADQLATVDRIRDALAAVPGVAAVAASWQTPTSGTLWVERLAAADYPSLPDAERLVPVNYVSPGWFATYGTRLVAGRDFTDRDRTTAPTVVIVNEAFAARYLGGRNVVGGAVRVVRGRDVRRLEIVGLSGDIVYDSLRDSMPPMMYLPMTSVPFTGISLSVRAAGGPPARLVAPVEAAIRRADPGLAVTVRSLGAQVDATLVRERLVAILSAFFGGLALALAALGLYGVTAYAVGRRRAEIGVRLALGAAPGSVVRLVLRRVTLLVGLGVAVGGVASFWAAGLTETLLFGLTPRDPATFVAAAAALVAVGLLAGWLPARHAARIDPTAVLRES